LDDVLLCERTAKGPAFAWPAERNELEHWRQRFMPGRLYTMNVLQSAPAEDQASTLCVPETPAGGWDAGS
jgi:hypothetical protein